MILEQRNPEQVFRVLTVSLLERVGALEQVSELQGALGNGSDQDFSVPKLSVCHQQKATLARSSASSEDISYCDQLVVLPAVGGSDMSRDRQ
jgi:hypothetical protein